MATAKEAELIKLLTSAISACTKAEGGDFAEEGRALDALKLLERQQVTAELLAKTEGGKKVKKLSKHPCEAIKKAASGVVDAWKKCVMNEQKQKQEASNAAAPEKEEETARTDSGALESQGSMGLGASTGPSKLVGHPARCGDSMRDKIRELLAEALAMSSSDDVPGDPCDVAVEIEEAMFKQNGGVNQKYKSKYRSLAFNLKDANNPDLRSKVLMGHIPGDLLVNLSAEELASDTRRQGNDKIRDHMKKECERGQASTASTDMFKCGKCKQRKCTYYQMQTRSADEPMTTFVTCTVCGKRWKFC